MRIQSIKIIKWRHFENIDLSVPEDAPVICLVGGNGTGKSQILELIAACAHRLGLSPGNESSRGDPFSEECHFEIQFYIGEGAVPALDKTDGPLKAHDDVRASWNRLLTITRSGSGIQIHAGGIDSPKSESFANSVVQIIRNSAAVHYMFLDADRAYPKMQVAPHELGQAFERDWDSSLKQSSFRLTRNLYEEWFRFLLGKENQENNRHVQRIRIARDAGTPEPAFVDQFDSYKTSIRKVLPHLLFVGIDPQKRDIRFDSTGTPLSFDQLSGGEREIAFLIGQIERFSLRKGLLLVDEPELHLNYDLLRNWIGFLKSTVEQGQIWLATHSLEVVEVTGQGATFLLQREEDGRRVKHAYPLNSQPVVATLSRAVGSPAFSISNLAFVLIEGEEEIGERERFRLMCDVDPHVRLMEAGSCREVVRRVEALRQLATESGQPIRLGGVIDRDLRSTEECREFGSQGFFVLPVHEIENFYLHPPTLDELMRQLGSSINTSDLVIDAADKRAGTWIFDAARTDKAFVDFPAPSKATRELVHQLAWSDFANLEDRCEAIALSDSQLTKEQLALLKRHIIVRAKIYARKRKSEIWRIAEGKEVFRSIVGALGFSDEDAAERAITSLWSRRNDLIPEELLSLRQYIAKL
jgi:predicted ATPase